MHWLVKFMNEREKAVFGAILGEKKLKIIEWMLNSADECGFIFLKIAQICESINVSKPTVIDTIKLLESKKVLIKIKNGVYKLNVI
ncbi:hypothetical protein LMG7974_01894 [Campylobacter majalis]|uniref:Plasmid replication protein RepL domain-containing protein n=2 Tax=Campylobacter majalis TaxID=2790656 RepID=A0ABN7KCP0_9BACT|nr:hypothetical protein LMG7974_01894 [Campylobacter majalis]